MSRWLLEALADQIFCWHPASRKAMLPEFTLLISFLDGLSSGYIQFAGHSVRRAFRNSVNEVLLFSSASLGQAMIEHVNIFLSGISALLHGTQSEDCQDHIRSF